MFNRGDMSAHFYYRHHACLARDTPATGLDPFFCFGWAAATSCAGKGGIGLQCCDGIMDGMELTGQHYS